LDYDPDTMPRPYRTWRWVAVFFCLLWAAGALVGGVHVGFVTIHQGLPEQAAAKSWVLMKTFACFFGGGIVGAYLGGLIARFLPK